MWRARGRLVSCQFHVAICLMALYIVSGSAKEKCDPFSLPDSYCGVNARCVLNDSEQSKEWTATCQCERGYELVNDVCKTMPSTERSVATTANPTIDQKQNSGGASVAAGLLIPTFLILFGAATYYSARRYKWLQRFRQFRQNRYGNVLVTRDETDDDDPPIA